MAKVLKPQFGQILVQPIDEEIKTPSGFKVAESAKEKPSEGEVKAVGEGTYQNGILIPMKFQIGQRVMFKKWGGQPVDVDGKEMLLIEQLDVLSLVEINE